jgi:UDP-glucose 4-epimerase
MNKKALLIGGCGFIGYHLARKLVASGRSVTVLGRNEPSDENKVDGAIYIVGNFADVALMTKLVDEHQEVVHLAYATVPNTSFENPLADLEQNLHPAVQLFEMVARKGARLMLVSSGGTVYGEAQSRLIAEDHPTQPISPYGVTKLTLEKYAFLYAITKSLDVVCVRPSNPYGEGQKPFSGQGFISTAMAVAMQGKPITIYGEQGTVRDYIYIGDVVDAMVTVLESGERNETYNIGSGVGRSNLEVVQSMTPLLAESGFDIHVSDAPSRPFDVQCNILDCRKLRKLGWEPYTEFAVGLKRVFTWLRNHL